MSPKINKPVGSNNRIVGRIPQKLINMEVLIRHVVGNFFSKRIRKTPCLLESSEYLHNDVRSKYIFCYFLCGF